MRFRGGGAALSRHKAPARNWSVLIGVGAEGGGTLADCTSLLPSTRIHAMQIVMWLCKSTVAGACRQRLPGKSHAHELGVDPFVTGYNGKLPLVVDARDASTVLPGWSPCQPCPSTFNREQQKDNSTLIRREPPRMRQKATERVAAAAQSAGSPAVLSADLAAAGHRPRSRMRSRAVRMSVRNTP
eukprot:365517-Chlamydomonas_euryale.AAC.8